MPHRDASAHGQGGQLRVTTGHSPIEKTAEGSHSWNAGGAALSALRDRHRIPTLKLLSGAHPLPTEPIVRGPALQASGSTDRGNRRGDNEDQFLIVDVERVARIGCSSFDVEPGTSWPMARQAKILMVADGIGGHAHGRIASAVAVDAMLDAVAGLDRVPSDGDAFGSTLEQFVAYAQDAVLSVARRKHLNLQPGTTLTMAYVEWPTMYIAHVGDSRCYLMRDGDLRQLTQDHTLAAMLVEAGLKPEQAEVSRGRHVLMNAVGGGTKDLRVDFHRRTLRPSDRVLLCTDGLHDLLPPDRIAEVIAGASNPSTASAALISAALAAGGDDNVTAVVMYVAAHE
jgi:protein phosphatase